MVPVLILACAALLAAGPAEAEPYVYFEPGMVMLDPSDVIDVSLMVDAVDDSISGFQLYLSFDPTVVELTTATEGELYATCGYSTWFIAEEEEPGLWHFFNTVMGTGTYLLPPGELLHLEFTVLDYGTAQLHMDSMLLADVRRENLPVASYEHGYIFVVPVTGVEEGGGIARVGPAYPNPFVSTTAVPFFSPMEDGPTTAEIYDVTGRLVRTLRAPAGTLEGELTWDGRDARGEELPASVYFLRLTGTASAAHCRLVKTE